MPLRQPCAQPQLSLFARHALVIGQIIGLAHERVDRADRVAPCFRERDKRIVKILGFALGDRATFGVGALQRLVVQWSFPAQAALSEDWGPSSWNEPTPNVAR